MSPLLLVTICISFIFISHSRKHSREEEFSRIKSYELIHVDTNLFDSQKIIELNVFDQYYKVQLITNEDIIPSQIRHTSYDITKNGNTHRKLHESCHYFGTVLNTNNPSQVALSFCNRRGIRGRITAFNQTIIIHPSAHFLDFKNSVINKHKLTDQVLVYKLSDFDLTNIGVAKGIKMVPKNELKLQKKKPWLSHNLNQSLPFKRRLYSSSNPGIVEVLIINGPERTDRYRDDYEDDWYDELFDDLADVINQVNTIYKSMDWDDFGGSNSLKIKWVELQVIEEFNGIYQTLAPRFLSSSCMDSYSECRINGQSWLSTLQGWIYRKEDVSTFDNVQLISDMRFSSNTAGWGNIGQVCRGAGSVSDISEQWGLSYVVKTVAHELGHNFGMRHDSDVGCGSGYIMGTGDDDFSSCSVNSLESYLRSNDGLTCLDTPSNAWDREVESNVEGSDNGSGPDSTPSPVDSPSGGDFDCDYYDCLNINAMSEDDDSRSYNGEWEPAGCNNDMAYYFLDGEDDRYLCYSSYGMWMITAQLCGGTIKAYTGQRNMEEITGTANNWWVNTAEHGWDLDSYVTVSDCSGAFTECDSGYNKDLCISQNGTHSLWDDEKNFDLHVLCSNDKPVYRNIVYGSSTEEEDEWGNTNENILMTYYLHYYEELKYSDGSEMIGRWVISKDEITTDALAVCENENLLECTENSWIVLSKTELSNSTKDGYIEKVIDKYMAISNDKCESVKNETNPDSSMFSMSIVIVIVLAIVLIGCVIGFCLWHRKKRRKRVEFAIGGVPGDSGDDGYDNNETAQGNETQMIEKMVAVPVEDDDDEVATPFNR